MDDIINFKGISNGVFLEIGSEDKEEVEKSIHKKIKRSKKFFEGSKLLGISSDKLSLEDRLDLAYSLKYKYGFQVSIDDIFKDVKKEIRSELQEEVEKEKEAEINTIIAEQKDREKKFIEECRKRNSQIIDEGMTRFVYGTLRSGQEVDFKGNIVVVGDVNPGAFLKAKGNIIVLGRLNGIAYAGLNGDKKAIVAAYDLLPSQLRIADLIVRAPDNDKSKFKIPEVAKIVGDEVVIEPYLPNK